MTYSGGMWRRVDLASALVVPPRILFLDEPTTGLDPRSRRDVWTLVGSLASQGITVLLTTQYLEEADVLSDSIVVLDHGQVIASGTAEELKRRVGGSYCQVTQRTRATCHKSQRPWRGLTGSTSTPTPDRCRCCSRRRGDARRGISPGRRARSRTHRYLAAQALARRGVPAPHRTTGRRPIMTAMAALTERALKSAARDGALMMELLLPVAYLAGFTVALHGLVDTGRMTYAQYLVPAVVVQSVIFVALITADRSARDHLTGLGERLGRCRSPRRFPSAPGWQPPSSALWPPSPSRWSPDMRSGFG